MHFLVKGEETQIEHKLNLFEIKIVVPPPGISSILKQKGSLSRGPHGIG